MATKLVIKVRPDGTLETLKHKAFDTSKLGGFRKIRRITIIEWHDAEQAFYIEWLAGPYKDKLEGRWSTQAPENLCSKVVKGVLYFDDYDVAVQHEVARVNALRLLGHNFDNAD